MIDDLLTAQDVKKLLKVSLALVYRLSDQGRLRSVRIPCPGVGSRKKHLVRFKKQDVIDFIEAHYCT